MTPSPMPNAHLGRAAPDRAALSRKKDRTECEGKCKKPAAPLGAGGCKSKAQFKWNINKDKATEPEQMNDDGVWGL
ncbi:hypothetical protein, partial [Mesorhizobium sp. M0522]|uniref:hypothetical protein n=1 Tax=Mesorhizobium sp. M0522 TaxID=2956958 RepID=UPI00333B32B9